jgi:uncharacterized membrane protein SirB2
MYVLLKHVHMTAVVLSGSLFALRGVWMTMESPLLRQRWVRIVPHIIDSLLLASAIALAITIQQYPLVHAWLTAKLFALVVYIVLGSIALKRGKTRRIRIFAFIGALLTFSYIIAVALSHNPVAF